MAATRTPESVTFHRETKRIMANVTLLVYKIQEARVGPSDRQESKALQEDVQDALQRLGAMYEKSLQFNLLPQ